MKKLLLAALIAVSFPYDISQLRAENYEAMQADRQEASASNDCCSTKSCSGQYAQTNNCCNQSRGFFHGIIHRIKCFLKSIYNWFKSFFSMKKQDHQPEPILLEAAAEADDEPGMADEEIA